MFETFVVPYISQLGEKLGMVRLHSCGITDHLLSAITKITNLGIIDTGSGTSIAKIREIAGNEIEINIFPSVNLLLQDTPLEKVRVWLYDILRENNDGPLKIAYHLEDNYSLENCLFIHDELERLKLIFPGRLY